MPNMWSEVEVMVLGLDFVDVVRTLLCCESEQRFPKFVLQTADESDRSIDSYSRGCEYAVYEWTGYARYSSYAQELAAK